MKSFMKIFSFKRPVIYTLLIAIIATVTLTVPSCSENGGQDVPPLLIDDEDNPPVSMTFSRIAKGSYVTGYTEADNMSVTMQMNSQTAENIYSWLTHFTVGEEITEAEDYSPFRFTVEYEKGEKVSFGFYDCEIDGKVSWHRLYLLDDCDSPSYYTDILISYFKANYSQLYLMTQ